MLSSFGLRLWGLDIFGGIDEGICANGLSQAAVAMSWKGSFFAMLSYRGLLLLFMWFAM